MPTVIRSTRATVRAFVAIARAFGATACAFGATACAFGATACAFGATACAFGATACAFGAIASVVLASGTVRAESLPTVHPRIVNGVLTDDFPSVGALLRGTDAESASAWCSGTLIGCSTFLTAGHCIEGRTPGEFFVYLPNAGVFAVASIALHPSYHFPAADVGVLKLAAPVTGVAPTAIETDAAPPFGTSSVIVGYGRSGDPLFDYGLKRAGNVVTTSCTTIPSPGSDTTSVCWDFTAPLGPPGTHSNTCNADSGGPLLVDLGSGVRIAGTTSGGSSASCNPTDHSYDANVFTYRSFIEAQGGADLANTSCGSGPQVGDPGTTVVALDGSLSNATPDATQTFTVPNGTTTLRVAMNAIDDGGSDFDLYVKAGSAPTTTVYDCGRFGPNQFGVCEFTAPTPGTWYVLVHRFAGSGNYQVTVTEFATACAAPGSEGNPCDDGNPCTSVRRLPGRHLRRHPGRERHPMQRRQPLHRTRHLPSRRLQHEPARERHAVRRRRSVHPSRRVRSRCVHRHRSGVDVQDGASRRRAPLGRQSEPRHSRPPVVELPQGPGDEPRRIRQSDDHDAVRALSLQRRLRHARAPSHQDHPARSALEGVDTRLPLLRRDALERRPAVDHPHARKRGPLEHAGPRQGPSARAPRPPAHEAAERRHPAPERHDLLELDVLDGGHERHRALQGQERLSRTRAQQHLVASGRLV